MKQRRALVAVRRLKMPKVGTALAITRFLLAAEMKARAAAVEPELPFGVWGSDGEYFAECRSCGRSYELFHDPIKEGFDPEYSYCGGSPMCLP